MRRLQASKWARGLWRPLSFALGLLLTAVPMVAHAEPPVAPGPRAAAASAEPSEATPVFAYVVGALGLSALSVAGVTGFLAMNQKGVAEDHCSPTLRLCDGEGRQASETGRTLRDISTAAAIIGGVGVGLSAYLLLTAPARQNQVAVSVSLDGVSSKATLMAHF